MARPKKINTVVDAGKLADELIAIEAAKNKDPEDSAPENIQVDNPEGEDEPVSNADEDTMNYDLSKLDEEELPPEQIEREDKDLAHKFSVLQGKYNAETTRLSNLLSQTMTELQVLREQVAKQTPEPQVTVEDASGENAGIETLKEQYPELYKGFLNLARQEARIEVDRVVKGTNEKVDAITKDSFEAKQNTYYARLSEMVPSWEQINNHPAFAKWLNEPEEFSGTTRRNLLGAAYNRLDANTSAKFFKAFIAEKGIKFRGNQASEDDEIAPDTVSGNIGRGSRVQTGEVTRAEMQKFYQDKAQGRLLGTETEIAKKEARFFQAIREGKVRG
jgi:hypothetical protein